jgi:short-subunit dehydrogenase
MSRVAVITGASSGIGEATARTLAFAAYAATKWGISGWSEALRVELQPDVRATDHITDPASRQANKAGRGEIAVASA